jgi:uncharacterized protein (TIGR00369 family)
MGGFVGENGSFLRKEDEQGVRFGFKVSPRHCNPFGTCHGGWLATMADLQLIMQAAWEAGLATKDLVTVSLSLDYLGSAKVGDWIESQARVVRRTRSLVFAEGIARTPARSVLRMNGIFQIRS